MTDRCRELTGFHHRRAGTPCRTKESVASLARAAHAALRHGRDSGISSSRVLKNSTLLANPHTRALEKTVLLATKNAPKRLFQHPASTT